MEEKGLLLPLLAKGDLEGLKKAISENPDASAAAIISEMEPSQRRTPLHIAAQNGNVEILKALLAIQKDGKNVIDNATVDIRDKKNKTSLQYAVQAGHVDAVNVLLKAGADPNANNIGGQTAVHYAAFQGNLDIMRALLAHGANLKIKNQDDQTVLHYACQTGNVALAKFLLEEHGSNVNINSLTKDHSLPIHFAVAYGHSDLVRYLLTRPVVVPSSVLDLDTNEEISDMLEDYISGDKEVREKKPKRKGSLTVIIPERREIPSVLQTPITPQTPLDVPVFPTLQGQSN